MEGNEVIHEDYPDEVYQVETEMESGTLIIQHLGEPEDVPEEDHTIHAQPSRVELRNESKDLEDLSDEELAHEIQSLKEESDDLYTSRSLEYAEKEAKLDEAIEEAKSRGYDDLSEMKG